MRAGVCLPGTWHQKINVECALHLNIKKIRLFANSQREKDASVGVLRE